ncbi:unnamed protein product [Rotaria sp. Silwood2]|nr:unnamed protein product [Rotaria sp. Silwood2]CAF2975510.1 unnamed protein product [Rotaria sp. Silwood2]CAF3853154.1 unnamed protein product [Rotaria sp. Silwood2]CAF4096311.1 unnamed protein product [Rotaria sp. Silwood2]
MPLLTVIVFCATIFHAQSITYNITNSTASWQTILTNLKAGDVAVMRYGIYTTAGSGYFQLTLNGTLTKPIIIQGAPNESRPIIQCAQIGASAQNIMNIQGSNFMVKGIAFTKGSRGIRVGPAVTTNAIFDNIYIYNTTGTAFSANDAGNEYVNITLRNSEITNTNAMTNTTGECVYLGCTNDTCRIRDSVIDHNYCHDTLGSVGGSRAGFQVKSGSYNVIIRNNVCYKVVGPCIVVYDDYDRGRNLIDGNLAINAGTADLGIQCTSGATITNNIVINACASIYNNAINGSISATGIQLCGTFTIANNVFLNATANNLYPAVNSSLINKGANPPYQALYDYNGLARSLATPTVGAYEYSTTNNPGCVTKNSFKCGSSTAAVPQYPLIR